MKHFALLCVSVFVALFLFACSDSGNAVASAKTPTVEPGVTFAITDMYIDSYSVHTIIKNMTNKHLPAFNADYLVECDDYKKYASSYFYLDAYEQRELVTYINKGLSFCSITFSSIYTGTTFDSKSFVPWNGSFTANTSMF